MGSHYIIALIIDYSVGMLFGLVLNKRFTFNIQDKVSIKMLIKSLVSNMVIFSINLLSLYVLIDLLFTNKYIAQLLSLIIVAISSFLFYKFYIFKGLNFGK
jgi:putative flippase GtrA